MCKDYVRSTLLAHTVVVEAGRSRVDARSPSVRPVFRSDTESDPTPVLSWQ